MKFKPHDYQRLAIDKIINNNYSGLFLDMGLGKTVITLTAVDHLITLGEVNKVLVIAPLQTARNTWDTEQAKWDHLKGLKISLVLGTAKQREAALDKDADVYVINRENVQWLCDEKYSSSSSWPFDMVVIDELSSFKNPSAKRFKALRKKIVLTKRRVGLTGTPASNSYMDLWSEVFLLDRGERLERAIGNYRLKYFDPGRRNNYVVYEWKLKAFAKEQIDQKLSDLCISMKAVDFLDMPDKIITDVYVKMDEKERKIYDQFGSNHVLPDQDVIGTTAATVQGKLLQMANGFVYNEAKEPQVIHEHKYEALEELIEAAQGEPILVFYSFVADRDKLLERFGQARCLKDERDVAEWNSGNIPILLAHPASAGHGLNLQAGGHIIVWFGLPWSLELYSQANARLYRQGQQHPVRIYRILCQETHDDDVKSALETKNLSQESLLKALKARLDKWETQK